MIRKGQNNFISYKDRNFRNYRKRLFVIIGCIALVVGSCFIFIGGKETISAIASVGNSLFKANISTGETIADGLELAKSKSTLIGEKNQLDSQVKDLQAQLAELPTLKDDNAKLLEMLSRKKGARELIAARIIARPNQTVYDTLVIDIGSADGVRVGAKVFARGDIPIGSVEETDAHASKVTLYTTSGQTMKASIVGKDISIDLTGQGGGIFQTTLPRDIVIDKATPVVTIEGDTIAVTEESLADSRDPFQRILFRSPVNMFQLRYVGVEK